MRRPTDATEEPDGAVGGYADEEPDGSRRRMNPRLLILCACLGGMAIWAAIPRTPPMDQLGVIEAQPQDVIDGKKMLYQWDLPGEDPPDELEFDLNVWVDDADDKNRLYFSISEVHGYYVESLNLDFYYKSTADTTYEDSKLRLPVYINNYIKAGETFTDFVEVVDAEIDSVTDDIGSTENWGVEVTGYGRAREKNPEILHAVVRASTDAD